MLHFKNCSERYAHSAYPLFKYAYKRRCPADVVFVRARSAGGQRRLVAVEHVERRRQGGALDRPRMALRREEPGGIEAVEQRHRAASALCGLRRGRHPQLVDVLQPAQGHDVQPNAVRHHHPFEQGRLQRKYGAPGRAYLKT